VNSNTLTLFTVYVHKAVTAFSFEKNWWSTQTLDEFWQYV